MMLWWKQQFPRVPDLLKDTGQVFAVSVGIVREKGRNYFVEVYFVRVVIIQYRYWDI